MSRPRTPSPAYPSPGLTRAAAARREAIARGRLWVEMDRLWALIPDANCQGYCHTSCGPIGMSEAERDRMDRMYDRHIRDGEVAPGTMDCPALSSNGRCTVYMARPTLCRLWGSSDAMPCTYGCEPDGRLNELESMLILNASLSLGEDNPFLPEDYLVSALADEETAPLIRRFVGGDRSHLDELREKLIKLWRGKKNVAREAEE